MRQLDRLPSRSMLTQTNEILQKIDRTYDLHPKKLNT